MLLTTIISAEIIKMEQAKRYKSMGYDVKIGDIIQINVSDLPKYSTHTVIAQCDICGGLKVVEYGYYNDRIKTQNLFCCSCKCAMSFYLYIILFFNNTFFITKCDIFLFIFITSFFLITFENIWVQLAI